MEQNLQKIEQKMREMADQWIKTQPTNFEKSQTHPLQNTELSFDTFDKFKDAVLSIERRLLSQRRMARSGHPRYDVNKHIQLKTALADYLDTHPNWSASQNIRDILERIKN